MLKELTARVRQGCAVPGAGHLDHARNLEFEKAAVARDELFKLKEQLFGVAKHDSEA